MVRKYRFFLLPILLLVAVTVISQVKNNGLSINITGLHSNKGHVLISLFKDGNGYPDEAAKAIRTAKVSITNKSTVISFSGIPSGNYAIAILHDENDDEKMNTNFLGIPKEGYGFSNNAIGTFGPPSFSKASFQYAANQGKVIHIRAKY